MKMVIQSAFLATLAITCVGVPAQRAEPVGASQVFRVIAPSVVTITTNGAAARQGSGVVVGLSYSKNSTPNGSWVITNAHVSGVASPSLKVRANERDWAAKLEYADTVADLALLHVPELVLPVVSPFGAQRLEVGARVYAVGSPLGLDRSLSEGIVSGLRQEARVKSNR